MGREPGRALRCWLAGSYTDLGKPSDPHSCLGPGLPIRTIGRWDGAVLGPCHLWAMCRGLLGASRAQTAARPGAVVRPYASWASRENAGPRARALLLCLGK